MGRICERRGRRLGNQSKKIIALTFDACGGPHGSGYDAQLIDLLIQEKVPATLFTTGKWIDANYATFLQLAKEPLFELENHGFNHRPCAVDGESEYGIKGTATATDAFDEIEANARKIAAITGRRPKFYRSATAFTDEACAKIAGQLNTTVVSFDVLSGDAVPKTPKSVIVQNVLRHVRPGAIISCTSTAPLGLPSRHSKNLFPRCGHRATVLPNWKIFRCEKNEKNGVPFVVSFAKCFGLYLISFYTAPT